MKTSKESPEKRNVVPFQSEFNHISPLELEEIMEALNDRGYLSETGVLFRKYFWELFIKVSHD